MTSAADHLKKAATGIAGLDEVTGGGLPSGRATLVCGGPGCGKTHELKVIDISQRPELGEGEQFIAAPTLIKKLPLRRFLGDMTNTQNILIGLDLRETAEKASGRN